MCVCVGSLLICVCVCVCVWSVIDMCVCVCVCVCGVLLICVWVCMLSLGLVAHFSLDVLFLNGRLFFKNYFHLNIVIFK